MSLSTQGWKGTVISLHGTVHGGYQVIKLQRDIVEPSRVQWSNVHKRSLQPAGARRTGSGSTKKTWGTSQEFQYPSSLAESETLLRNTTDKFG